MHIIQHGSGPPLVLIPGIQGRWEYLKPAIGALAARFRVVTFALCDEPRARAPFEESRGFDNYVDQVAAAMDQAGIDRGTICGVSFGGLVALAFAARYPTRTSALVLASTPGPGWQLRRRHTVYTRAPRLLGPLFLIEAPRRVRRELRAAFPNAAARRRFVRSQLRTLVAAPVSLRRMAVRARLISTAQVETLAARVTAPTLIVTGERSLDYVVPTTTSEGYERLIGQAHAVVLESTGHLGSITRPEAFAAAISDFVQAAERERRPSSASG